MPESDLIIEAVYETIPTYKVTFNSNGGTVSGTKTVTSGENMELCRQPQRAVIHLMAGTHQEAVEQG